MAFHGLVRDDSSGSAPVTPGFNFSNYPFMAPGPNDMRSPCPGLNALANHGILPRNGSNITTNMILQAAVDAYNVQPHVLSLAAKIGMLVSAESDTLSLDDINMHENIEHDASTSRGDYYFGDNHSFNETIFQTLVNVSDQNLDTYNGTTAGQSQKARLEDSIARNPELINTNKEFTIRTRESSLYLAVMGNASTGIAPKEYVNIFFREDRLPIEEGWKRSDVPITSTLLDAIAQEIKAASEWPGSNSNCSQLVISPNGITQNLNNTLN
ncbi:Cloroperoxidase [Stereum hirsutum FP-91666 SS1]|uniref:Cloroperoxidase n=1 Tax=Stereum hirsutum (strain FP-91666) TaxID=721885 RepID=UPI0004449FD3|nr:Cloroperoxidase [Stereum hirsutum FP-91666 SS1]EIM82419.1 Cloroperoxidase [Stereum hirsutum FP-91666 SS1]